MELASETRRFPDIGQLIAARALPTLTIMHHPRLRRIGERVALPALVQPEGRVEVSRLTPEMALPGSRAMLPLATHFVSRKPVMLLARSRGAVAIDATAVGEGVVKLDGMPLKGVA